MPKNPNGAGSLYWSRSRHRWIALVPLPDGTRKFVTTSLPREARAAERRAVLADLRAKFAAPITTAAPPLTVVGYLEAWNAAAPIAATSRERRAGLIRFCLAPHLSGLLLSELTHQHIAGALAALAAAVPPYAPVTINTARGVLSTALREAVRHGLLDRNPADLVRGCPAPRRQYPLLTQAQYRALLDAAGAVPSGALVVLALTVGARVGELLALRWSDYDGHTLRIERSLNNLRNDAVRITATKTASSRRTLILPAVAIAALDRHRAEQAAVRLAAGPDWQDHGLIFPAPRGGLARAQNLAGHLLARLLKAQRLPEMRFHDLRHNAASHLLHAGVPLQVVSELLGHASPAITQRVYAHLLTGQKQLAADAIDRMLGSTEQRASH